MRQPKEFISLDIFLMLFEVLLRSTLCIINLIKWREVCMSKENLKWLLIMSSSWAAKFCGMSIIQLINLSIAVAASHSWFFFASIKCEKMLFFFQKVISQAIATSWERFEKFLYRILYLTETFLREKKRKKHKAMVSLWFVKRLN